MRQKTVAYTAPFFSFMLFVALAQGLDKTRLLPADFGAAAAIYLVYPLQTLACAAMLACFWRQYALEAPREAWLASTIALLAFALWVSPQVLFHLSPRLAGFDPGVFSAYRGIYWASLVVRFLRLIVVVPLLEEIFWRGFLLRYLISEDFDKVPFGAYSLTANAVVAAGFMLEHSPRDWPAALATGLLYNFIAFRTKSLSSCVLAHALTNALLGAFIVATRQWGFW
jgi:CAAX prenyl protease-like protein